MHEPHMQWRGAKFAAAAGVIAAGEQDAETLAIVSVSAARVGSERPLWRRGIFDV